MAKMLPYGALPHDGFGHYHTGQPPKMAKMLPYGALPHDGFWPLLGQKPCCEKCDPAKMGARTPPNVDNCRAAAQQLNHSQPSLPDRSCFFCHIIIIMDIDDDMMDLILNNQQNSGCQ
jgi:hypothetical protein